jgi:hypothetical protein
MGPLTDTREEKLELLHCKAQGADIIRKEQQQQDGP